MLALFEEVNRREMQEFAALLGGREKIPLEEMMHWYRSLFTFERNFVMSLKTEDFVWLKGHLRDFGMFDAKREKAEAEKLLRKVCGVRSGYDAGVIVNFIKGIYSMTENRDSFCKESIETNIDLIFQTICQYIKGED